MPTFQGNVTVVAANEGDLTLRLMVGPNAFLDVTPIQNPPGRFQTVLDTVNNRDLAIMPGTGNVGIGTISPGSKLDVAGPVHASSFPTSSDIRFKTNITPLVNVLEKLENIHGVSFEWNELYESLGRSTGHEEIGLVAQEVEKVFPELVTTWGNEKYRAIDYGRLTGVLVEAIKELRAETQTLRSRIGELETNRSS